MVRLIPKIDVTEIKNSGERLVATALLEQLPDECILYHSYPWLRTERALYSKRESLRQGEADFVIIHPKAGLMVLEVKGGEIEYDESAREWVRVLGNKKERITDPFEQASRSMHHLVEKISQSREEYSAPFGYAVVFPHCDYSGTVPPGAHPQVVYSSRDMTRLGDRVKNTLAKWQRKDARVELSPSDLQAIQLAISPIFKLTPILFRKLDDQEARIHRLTENQMQLLDYLDEHDRAAIKGVAGSGKTILANAQAQKFAMDGKKTLFVCYNSLLAESLQLNAPEVVSGQLTYTSFHSLCKSWCKRAGIPFNPPDSDPEFWKNEASNLLIDAIDTLEDRYDAVVVDEGQDFMPGWWIALEMINSNADEGPMYVFYDPHQNIFDTVMNLPELGEPFPLPVNCRNTKEIAKYCGLVNDTKIKVREETPLGEKVTIECVSSSIERRRYIKNTISDWIRKGSLKPSRIAMLSFYDKLKTCMAQENGIGDIPIVSDQQKWRDDKGVLFSTIRAFKGLEADAIVLVDIPDFNVENYFSKADLYVGCSRAKHLLVIAAKENFSL